jgi:hypothetical protein
MTALHEAALALCGLALMALLWPLGYLAAGALLTALLVARDLLEDAAHQVHKRLQSKMDRP